MQLLPQLVEAEQIITEYRLNSVRRDTEPGTVVVYPAIPVTPEPQRGTAYTVGYGDYAQFPQRRRTISFYTHYQHSNEGLWLLRRHPRYRDMFVPDDDDDEKCEDKKSNK
jgi:hypothetical protein